MISSGLLFNRSGIEATLENRPTCLVVPDTGSNNLLVQRQATHEVSASGTFSFHSATSDLSPLQRVTSLSIDASNVASSYKISDLNHHRSTVHLPSMMSTSRRYSPYPLHKPSKRCPSRSSIVERAPHHPYPSLYGVHESPYADIFFWEGVLALQQANLGSPYSDDSVVATPVSDQGLWRQAFIAGEQEDILNPDSIDSWLTLHPPNSKHLDNQSFQTINFDLNPSSSLSQVETFSSSLSPSQSSCSFATTFPQFISPFSDAAVTSTPQSHPLYAPKPVRPIPKACFAPPEADTLPTTSLLFRPVSESAKQSGRTDSPVSGWTNQWT